MTMTKPSSSSHVPVGLQALLDATQVLREARQLLRGGNVVKGVTQHEGAKSALFETINTWSANGPAIVPDSHPLHEQLGAFVQASLRYQQAYNDYRRSGAASSAALALVRAEASLIGQFEQLN